MRWFALIVVCVTVFAAADEPQGIQVMTARYASGDQGCNATAWVAARCNGKTSCELVPSNGMCGDPRENFPKQVAITYRCGANVLDVVAGEADRVTLTCKGVERSVLRLHERLDLAAAQVQREGLFRIDIPEGYRYCRHAWMEHSAAPVGHVTYSVDTMYPDFTVSYSVPCAGLDAGAFLRETGDKKAESIGRFFEKQLSCVGGGNSWLHLGISVQVAKTGQECPDSW